MKAIKLFSAVALFFGLSFNLSAQDYVYTVIDIYGNRYSDQMMLFTVPGCTSGFDNGWDANKMFGTTLAPQLFNVGTDGYYQINSVNDVNNTYLGFKAGEDTTYTMVFTNVLVETKYQELYLIDSVANKTINIFATGTTYTFTTAKYSDIVKRFKIVTQNPAIVVAPVVIPITETATTSEVVPPTTATTDTIATAPTTEVVPPTTTTTETTVTPSTTETGTTVVSPEPTIEPAPAPAPVTKGKGSKVKITSNRNLVVVDNQTTGTAEVKMYDANTGQCVTTKMIPGNAKSTIDSKQKPGTYIVVVTTSTEQTSTTIMLQ